MANLPIPDETTWIKYDSQTGTGPFSFTFSVFAKADLRVKVGDTELAQSGFTFTGTLIDSGYDGGSITLSVAAAAEDVLIWREVTPARASDFAPASSVSILSIDAALDRLTAHAQDARRDLGRAIKVSLDADTPADTNYDDLVADVATHVSQEALDQIEVAGGEQVDAVEAAGAVILTPTTGSLAVAEAASIAAVEAAGDVILTPTTGTLAVAEAAAIAAVEDEGDDQVARVAATPGSGMYETKAAGDAASLATGAHFVVPGAAGDGFLVYRVTGAGTSTLVNTLADITGLTAVEAVADGAAEDVAQLGLSIGLRNLLPNLFPQADLDIETTSALSGSLPTATTYQGVPCWSIPASAGATGTVIYRFARSLFDATDKISASIRFLYVTPASAGTGAARFLVMQRNSGATEIGGTRSTVTVCNQTGLLTAATLEHAAIALHADTAVVDVYLDLSAVGSDARTMYFNLMMIAQGDNPAYRQPPAADLPVEATGAEAVTGTSTTKFMSPAAARSARTGTTALALGLVDLEPNLFLPGELDLSDKSRLTVPTGRLTATTKDGVPCWSLTTLAGAGESSHAVEWEIPRSEIAGDVFSSSFRILGVDGTGNASTGIARVLTRQYNGSSEITGSRVTNTISDTAAGLTTATTYENAAIAIDPACTAIRLYFAINGTDAADDRTMYFRDMMIASGSVPYFRRPSILSNGGRKFAVVGPSGNDTTGDGSAGQPYATLNKALDSIGGHGAVFLLYSDAYDTDQQISPTKITGAVEIYGEYSDGDSANPTINLGTLLTGITKTVSQTKIYQTTRAADASMQWFWQHGVADARTLISAGERHEAHGGRANRLPATKVVRVTDDSSQAAAFAEMEGASDPRFYENGGVLYFTADSGGDATAGTFYVDGASGLIASGTLGANGSLGIHGLNVLYGGVNLRPFKRSQLKSVSVIGSRANAVDYYGQFEGDYIEGAGAGSHSGDLGDGLNGHDYGEATVSNAYLHDNKDDGESAHERGRMRMRDSFTEYNGGTGVAPAYGCDALYFNVFSQNDQRISGRKPGAFAVIGGPEAPDVALDTRARFVRCRAKGATVGFYDGRPSLEAYGIAEDCVAENCATYGFDLTEIRDCRIIGTTPSGGARSSRTSVVNSTTVT